MHQNTTATTRTRRSLTIAAFAAAVSLALLAGAGSALAETTTTGSATVTTATATTATDTTAAGGASVSTTAPTATATTAGGASPAGADGITPAAAGFEPPNPGLLAAQMGIQFWPEYDTNDVLVLLDVTLPATTAFPYKFSFYVPKGAQLAGLAEIDDSGNFDYTLGTPQFTPGDVMDMVTVTVPSRTVLRLEYYFDPGMGAPGAKSYTLAFQAPADVGQLSVGVQQPLGATGFSAGSIVTQTTVGGEGFTYSFGNFSGIKAGDLIQIPVAYTRSDPDPSRPPGDTGSDPAQKTNSTYILLLGVVLVLGVGVVAGYRLFARRGTAPVRAGSQPVRRPPSAARGTGGGVRPSGSKPAQRSSGKGAVQEAPSGIARFCTQCGGRLTKKDRYCPQCGHEREN